MGANRRGRGCSQWPWQTSEAEPEALKGCSSPGPNPGRTGRDTWRDGRRQDEPGRGGRAEQPASLQRLQPERCVRPRHDAQGPFGSGNHARAGLRPARPLSGSAQGALAGLWAARAAAGQWQAAVVAPTLLVQKRRRLATCVLLAFKQSTLKIDCATRESKMNSAPDWGRGPARTLAGANQPRAGRAGLVGQALSLPQLPVSLWRPAESF